jgi:drug/metabolite transporter (DMT)-like permease
VLVSVLAETIKSSAPFFTVVLTYFLLGQRTEWRVNLSLIPIVLGLVFCSLSDSSFHVIGFIAALMSNCVDCIQNVLTKRLLNRSYSYVIRCAALCGLSERVLFSRLAFLCFAALQNHAAPAVYQHYRCGHAARLHLL